jgi:hypothetical protein
MKGILNEDDKKLLANSKFFTLLGKYTPSKRMNIKSCIIFIDCHIPFGVDIFAEEAIAVPAIAATANA